VDWINAFFGSEEEMNKKRELDLHHPSEEESYLNHGYNEKTGINNLNTEDLKEAAKYRGGSFEQEAPKDIYQPVEWKCAFGHSFKLSVNAVLHGGHWCPECLRKSWNYPAIARKNPFFAQVWDPQHSKEETYEIPILYSAYDIMNELKEKLGLDKD